MPSLIPSEWFSNCLITHSQSAVWSISKNTKERIWLVFLSLHVSSQSHIRTTTNHNFCTLMFAIRSTQIGIMPKEKDRIQADLFMRETEYESRGPSVLISTWQRLAGSSVFARDRHASRPSLPQSCYDETSSAPCQAQSLIPSESLFDLQALRDEPPDWTFKECTRDWGLYKYHPKPYIPLCIEDAGALPVL